MVIVRERERVESDVNLKNKLEKQVIFSKKLEKTHNWYMLQQLEEAKDEALEEHMVCILSLQ